jgi:RNA polymerase sigma-B factor
VRERLIAQYMPLARRMASRYAGISEPYDDLLQVASIGLMNAVDRYDPALGVPFGGYAKPTIMGELKRHFRDRTWTIRVPRSLHDLLARVERANEAAIARLGRPASVAELSAELGVEPAAVLEALEADRNRRPRSLDAPPPGADGDLDGNEWLGADDDSLQLIEDRVALRGLLPGLGERERQILHLRFIEEMPQTRIAERIGVSQMQVSRLLRRTLEQMRAEAEAA